MRKIAVATLMLTSAYAADDYWCLNTLISAQGDYGYLHRSEIRELRLAEDSSIIDDQKPKRVLDTDDLVDRMGSQHAARGGLTLHGDCYASFEALYTYVWPWKGKKTIERDGTLQFPFEDLTLVNDYVDADKAVGVYESQLQSGEANYWGHITPKKVNYFSFSWNLGFRFVYLKEEMDLFFTKGVQTSLYQIKTLNLLYGVQMGAWLDINPTRCWTWTFWAKGVAFLNNAKNDVDIRDDDNTTVLLDYKKRRYTDSYLLEGYAQLSYNLFSCFSVHAGYQGYILTGVVLAPNQRPTSIEIHRHINRKGQIVIHGFYVGADLGF